MEIGLMRIVFVVKFCVLLVYVRIKLNIIMKIVLALQFLHLNYIKIVVFFFLKRIFLAIFIDLLSFSLIFEHFFILFSYFFAFYFFHFNIYKVCILYFNRSVLYYFFWKIWFAFVLLNFINWIWLFLKRIWNRIYLSRSTKLRYWFLLLVVKLFILLRFTWKIWYFMYIFWIWHLKLVVYWRIKVVLFAVRILKRRPLLITFVRMWVFSWVLKL